MSSTSDRGVFIQFNDGLSRPLKIIELKTDDGIKIKPTSDLPARLAHHRKSPPSQEWTIHPEHSRLKVTHPDHWEGLDKDQKFLYGEEIDYKTFTGIGLLCTEDHTTGFMLTDKNPASGDVILRSPCPSKKKVFLYIGVCRSNKTDLNSFAERNKIISYEVIPCKLIDVFLGLRYDDLAREQNPAISSP